jgi:hypothetical protein
LWLNDSLRQAIFVARRPSPCDLRALFSGDKTPTLIYQQIERDQLRL